MHEMYGVMITSSWPERAMKKHLDYNMDHFPSVL